MILAFSIIFIIEILLSLRLNYKLNVGIHPESGKFTIWNVKHELSIQEKIAEEFQPDLFQETEAQKNNEEITIYGSTKLYNFIKHPIGNIQTTTPLGTFKLLRMLIIIDLLVLFIIFSVKKRLRFRPSQIQILFESLYSFFDNLVAETLGPKKITFTPYIVTIFLFIWVSNMIGLIPVPGFMEPTRNLNVPLGMGLMAVIMVHITAIRHKGFFHHIQTYINPLKNPLFILDSVGEVSKAVSISFRLFGNILGGAIIILVVSSLIKYVILPIGLNFFFGIFVGSIQAFVFTMLSLTYIGVEISE